MARLPTVDIPSADSLRPIDFSGEKKILRPDVSRIGSGAIYGGRQLQQLGEQVAKQEEERADFDYENEKAKALVSMSQFEDEEDKNPDWKNSQTRMDERFKKIEEEVSANLKSPRQKEKFQQWMTLNKERTASRIRGTSFKYEASDKNNAANERLNELSATVAKDRSKIDDVIESAKGIIDGSVASGYRSAENGGIVLREWKNKTIKGVIQTMEDSDDALAAIEKYKDIFSVEEAEAMKEQVKRKGADNFGWQFVNDSYNGRNHTQVRQEILKIPDADKRKAANAELNTRLQNEKYDKSLREAAAFSHYVESEGRGIGYARWAKENPGTDLSLDPSVKLSLIRSSRTDGKEPPVTPDAVLTTLATERKKAQATGDYRALWKAVDDNRPYMSKEDKTIYLNMRKDMTIPQAEDRRLANQALLDTNTVGLGKKSKAKLKLLLGDFERKFVVDHGRLPDETETRDQFFAPAMVKEIVPMWGKDTLVFERADEGLERIENVYFLGKKAEEMDVELDEDQLEESLGHLAEMREKVAADTFQLFLKNGISPTKNPIRYNKAVELQWEKARGSYDFRSRASETD